MPEVRKYPDKTCWFVWKTDGRSVSEDLEKDGERKVNLSNKIIYNYDYGTLIQEGIKILTKIITKR